jgi:hypothetical protein
MSTRLCTVVVQAADPRATARFWAELLDWHQEGADVTAPPDDGCEVRLTFVPEAGQKEVKNRLHLDLASESPDHQMATVSTALSLGAARADVGQRNVPWVVLADPAGNEFCVLDSRPEYATTGALAAIVVDALDQQSLAEFWSSATGWPLVATGQVWSSLRSPNGRGPWMEFIHTEEPHKTPNRITLELRPDTSQADEVARLVELGARKLAATARMADPEGNEFEVLRPA